MHERISHFSQRPWTARSQPYSYSETMMKTQSNARMNKSSCSSFRKTRRIPRIYRNQKTDEQIAFEIIERMRFSNIPTAPLNTTQFLISNFEENSCQELTATSPTFSPNLRSPSSNDPYIELMDSLNPFGSMSSLMTQPLAKALACKN